jgi:hypothetical protein
MVPQTTMIPTRNVVISQDLIGTPLPSRPNPSLPPGYRSLNAFVSIPTQAPFGLFVPPGYNVVVGFVPTPSQVLSGGLYVPPPPLIGGSGSSGSNLVGSTNHPFTSSYQLHVGGHSQVGAQPQLWGQPQVGVHNPLYGQNAHGSQSQLWNLPFQVNPQPSGGKHPQVNSFVPSNFSQSCYEENISMARVYHNRRK